MPYSRSDALRLALVLALTTLAAPGCSILFDGSGYRGGTGGSDAGTDSGEPDGGGTDVVCDAESDCADGQYCDFTAAQPVCRNGCNDENDCEDPETDVCDTETHVCETVCLEDSECAAGEFCTEDTGECISCDTDGDGYFAMAATEARCGGGGRLRPGDCDDGDAGIHPFALPTCGNGVEESCGSRVLFGPLTGLPMGFEGEVGLYDPQHVYTTELATQLVEGTGMQVLHDPDLVRALAPMGGTDARGVIAYGSSGVGGRSIVVLALNEDATPLPPLAINQLRGDAITDVASVRLQRAGNDAPYFAVVGTSLRGAWHWHMTEVGTAMTPIRTIGEMEILDSTGLPTMLVSGVGILDFANRGRPASVFVTSGGGGGTAGFTWRSAEGSVGGGTGGGGHFASTSSGLDRPYVTSAGSIVAAERGDRVVVWDGFTTSAEAVVTLDTGFDAAGRGSVAYIERRDAAMSRAYVVAWPGGGGAVRLYRFQCPVGGDTGSASSCALSFSSEDVTSDPSEGSVDLTAASVAGHGDSLFLATIQNGPGGTSPQRVVLRPISASERGMVPRGVPLLDSSGMRTVPAGRVTDVAIDVRENPAVGIEVAMVAMVDPDGITTLPEIWSGGLRMCIRQ